jgi:dolichyl-phosphate-mannose-protein mannosyltransferase
LLSLVFFSLAVTNLGYTQIPSTETHLVAGQSIDIDLGSSYNVQSLVFLVKSGSIEAVVTTDSQNSYPASIDNSSFNIRFRSQWFSERCDAMITQICQHIKIQFTQDTTVTEIAVISQTNQKIPIQSVNAISGNFEVHNLTDEQSLVESSPTYMTTQYFDEDLFVKSSEGYLHNQLPIEWTHPPLGKLIQAVGIAVFGLSPFGWRIMGVIFATLMIPLIYLLGKKLFGTWIGGFSAAFLLTFDFLHFTMARMGTGDTYLVFFSLASQLLFLIYLKNVVKDGWKTSLLPLFLAVTFFSLSFSTKWIALFGFAAELALLVALKLKDTLKSETTLLLKIKGLARPFLAVAVFVLFAVLVYFLIYIPDILAGRSLSDVWNLQFNMLHFHSGQVMDVGGMAFSPNISPFASPWYSWPLLMNPFDSVTIVPVVLGLFVLPNGSESLIVLLGNPVVWWVGFAAVISLTAFSLFRVAKKAAKIKVFSPSVFVLVFFFFQWVPFAFIQRDTFIYHFYLSAPFLILASTYFINKFWIHKWGKILTIGYFVLVLAVFVMFYAVISGAPTSNVNDLKWLSNWQFTP